jgi:hypothetical protein
MAANLLAERPPALSTDQSSEAAATRAKRRCAVTIERPRPVLARTRFTLIGMGRQELTSATLNRIAMRARSSTGSMLATIVLAGATLVACNSQGSSCGIPYRFTVRGMAEVLVGSCAGRLDGVATPVAVRSGDTIRVKTLRNGDGSAVFPIPVPADPKVVELTSRGAATATYTAREPGSTALNAPSDYCANESNASSPSCPTIIVTVRA